MPLLLFSSESHDQAQLQATDCNKTIFRLHAYQYLRFSVTKTGFFSMDICALEVRAQRYARYEIWEHRALCLAFFCLYNLSFQMPWIEKIYGCANLPSN